MSLVIDVLANRAATASPGDAFSATDTGQDFVWTTQWDEVPSTLLSRTWYTAKGMILAGSAASAPKGLAIGGTTGYVLSVDPAEVTGLKWIASAAGTPSGTVQSEESFGVTLAAGTSSEYSRGDHTHGSPTNPVTAHASSTNTHGAGTISGLADIVAHSGSTAVHGVTQVAGTADITTHAALTTVHSLGTMAQAASAAYTGTATYAAHTSTDSTHGAGTIASMTSIAAHAALTSVHSLGTASTAESASYATTANFASHTTAVATHGVAGTIAAKADITDTVLVTVDVTTNDVTSTKHGFAPKSTNNTALFLRNDATPTWAAPPGGAGILTTTYKTGTQAFSSTALANVTGLNFACASTTLYHYKFVVMHKTGTATVGMKWTVTWPTSTIAAGKVSMPVIAAGTTAEFHGLISVSGTAVTGTSQVAANTIGLAVIEGLVRATAAGSIQLKAAAEAAGTVWVMDYSVGLLYTIV